MGDFREWNAEGIPIFEAYYSKASVSFIKDVRVFGEVLGFRTNRNFLGTSFIDAAFSMNFIKYLM